MTIPYVLIFGTDKALASDRAKNLRDTLGVLNVPVIFESAPGKLRSRADFKSLVISWAVVVVDAKAPPVLTPWQGVFTQLKNRPHFAAVTEKALPSQIVTELAPDPVIGAKEDFSALINLIRPAASAHPNVDPTQVEGAVSATLPEADNFDGEPLITFGGIKIDPVSAAEGVVAEDLSLVSIPGGEIKFDAPSSAHDVGPILGADDDQSWGHSPSAVSALDPEISPTHSAFSASTNEVSIPEAKFSDLDSNDVQTIKRYGILKEREAREKEAAIQVLRRQMAQLQDRANRSDAERRRLAMSFEEAEANVRTQRDAHEQAKHQLERGDGKHQEEIRALQLRLDNAQFQAQRSERKLEEFRERVRSDIQKIRLRERELANRLELQKRDAEALLTAKDERLLQQKREIDRAEFEIDTLKERLLDETQRAEERAGRLNRALQSLRMAQGVLSGIDEEVLPNSGRDSGDGEAA